MTEQQVSQVIQIVGLLVTTINAFVLFYIANHQRGVARELKQFNGTILKALKPRDEPPQ